MTRITRRLHLELLEDRTLLDGHNTLATALPLAPGTAATGILPTSDFFRLTLTEPGRLITRVHATGNDTRLALLGPDGALLIQSDGVSASNRDDLIDQHLLAGTYFLEVTALSAGSGAYTLTTAFQPATPPQQPLQMPFFQEYPFATSPVFNVTADFNSDG